MGGRTAWEWEPWRAMGFTSTALALVRVFVLHSRLGTFRRGDQGKVFQSNCSDQHCASCRHAMSRLLNSQP